MAKFDNYKFRCSALGKIVSKSGSFTEGNKTYIEEVFIGEIYNRKKEAYGRALDKGVLCEEDGITMLNNTIYKGQLLIKNKERKSNDFIHGEADVFKNGIVHDVKNAFDLFTFGKANLSHDYYWQLVGYAWLWETDKAMLYYCLNNMPEQMLLEEERMLFYKNKWQFVSMEDENYLKACDELRAAHTYDNMPIYERFKSWEFIVLPEQIEQLKKAVTRARAYMNELYANHEKMIKNNMKLSGVMIAEYDKELQTTIIN